MDRHSSRTLAMQGACQLDAVGETFLADLDGFLADEGASGSTAARAKQIVEQIHAHQSEIDERITTAATNWDVKRIAPVERAILRMSACELLYHSDVPPNVVVNEAVELGKSFGSAESGAFINGVLDAIARRVVEDRQPGGDTPVPAQSVAVDSSSESASQDESNEAPHGTV